jgi:hypothetical protein
MWTFFTHLRQRNPHINDHARFFDRADNLVLALVGIPAALAFGRLVVSWTTDAILAANWLQWVVVVAAIVVLFNLLAIMFGLLMFIVVNWRSYREERSKAYVSLLAYPLLLIAVGSVIVMGVSAGSDNAIDGLSVQATLAMTRFGVALCLLMISLEGLTILLMPDILLLSEDTHLRAIDGSPVETLIMITYSVVFLALSSARVASMMISS